MTFTFSACQKSVVENSNKLSLPQTSPSVSPTLDLNPKPERDSEMANVKLYSSISKIDFKNFTYPWTEGQKIDEETFTLKNGEKAIDFDKSNGASLDKIEYGDVTNDGEKEAMISIAPETGGNCQCEMVFIYTLENKKLKLLWSFDTWDRAIGGLKRVYAENGELIVEVFGDDKFENDEWEFSLPKEGAGGLCCPTTFTKFRFKWNGKKFVVEGKPEMFDYDWRKEINKRNVKHDDN